MKKIINFILDETGSMMYEKDKTINDFNEYLEDVQKKDKSMLITLTKFNSDNIDIVYSKKKIKDVPKLTDETYNPEAMTPLYDAIGKTIRDVEKSKSKTEVLFVILTDGQENSSKEFDSKGITKLIKEKEGKGWCFIYLGAGVSAWGGSEKLGISKGMTMDQNDVGQSMCSARGASLAFCELGVSGVKNFMKKE